MRLPKTNEEADDGDRGTKNDGGGRRGILSRAGKKRLCENHLLYNNQSRVRTSPPIETAKKKNKKKKEKKKEATEVYDGFESSSGVRVSNRSSTQFEVGEVWAFSKESDFGFPKSYARIDRVLANSIQVTPLIAHPVLDEEVSFVEKGITLACGMFQPSQSTRNIKVSAFSHKVPFEKGDDGRSLYRIFPRCGEIWAMYVRWGDFNTGFEYKLVEVVSDYDEENGIAVFGLCRAEGKEKKEKGYYRRQVYQGFELIRSCSRSFLPVFSHRVPARRIVDGGHVLWEVGLH